MPHNPATLNHRSTPAKRLLLDFPDQWRPTYRELAERAGCSYQTVYELLNGLRGTTAKRRDRTKAIQTKIAIALGSTYHDLWE